MGHQKAFPKSPVMGLNIRLPPCVPPLAQIDQFHDLVTVLVFSRRLRVVSTSEQVRHFFPFDWTVYQPRTVVQYSVMVRENLMLFHQPHPHTDIFPQLYRPSNNDGTIQERRVLDGIWMAGYYRWLVLPTHWVNLREDAVLPPQELNHWEDNRQVHVSFHYMYSNMRRMFDLLPQLGSQYLTVQGAPWQI